jgi:predicted dehydrogenase
MARKRSKAIRAAVVGAGGIGKAHIRGLQAVGVEIAVLVDINEDAAAAMAAEFNIAEVAADYKSVVKRDDLDAVTVALPNFLHAPVSIAALQAGKHVFCEKPMAMNVAECKRINAAAAKARRVFQVGLHQRHQVQSVEARRWIDAGKLGAIYHSQVMAIRRRGVPGRGGWFTTRSKAGGGPMGDIGVHMLDLTCHLIGHPRPVAASAQTFRKIIHRKDYTYTGMWTAPVEGGPTDVEDAVTALIRFENGSTVDLQCAWALNTTEQKWQTEIFGEQAGVLVKPGSEIVIAAQEGTRLVDIHPQLPKRDPFESQMTCFRDACRSGRKPAAPAADGKQGQYVQALIDAIYKSADAGKEVRIKATDLA